MDDILTRFWEHLGGRAGGPMTFRLVLQPSMAIVLAIEAGVRDARAGRPAFLWTVLTDPARRSQVLKSGWKDLARVFTLAIVMDVMYQLWVFRWVYPLETVLVAFLLAWVPYLLVRGPAKRIASLIGMGAQ
jgi:hypothetical protein